MRPLRVRMLDGTVKTVLVDDSQVVANLMVVICTKIGKFFSFLKCINLFLMTLYSYISIDFFSTFNGIIRGMVAMMGTHSLRDNFSFSIFEK